MPDWNKLQRETPGNPNFDRSLEVPTFGADLFKWKRGRGHTSTGKLGIPYFPKHGFYIKSSKSGKTLRFSYDSAVNEANEFFDGEATAYAADDGSGIKVQIWLGETV